MALNNEWIGYIDRTYQQIKDGVLTGLQSLVPEMTDHTESNIFVKMVSIWGGLLEMLGYYVDNAAREAHLSTARLYWTGIKIARMYDYRVHGHIASSGDVTFILSGAAPSPVTIPAGTELQTADGILFYTTVSAVIGTGQTEVTVGVQQYYTEPTGIFVSNGAPNQEYALTGNVMDGSVEVTVNALAWSGQQTLGYSVPTDEHFVQSVNENKAVVIKFGDGVNGKIPPATQTIAPNFKLTLGADGNVGAFEIDTINSAITLPPSYTITVENRIRTSGGGGVETLDALKRRIPKSIRTLLRAVTEQDFQDLAELNAGVEKAGIIFSCGKGVDLYIVPDGGGIAGSPLIASTQAWMENYRLLLVGITTYAAGEVRLLLEIDLIVLRQYTQSVVVANVVTALTNFLSVANQEISGEVYLSDLYQTIENVAGVSKSVIRIMKPLPFARITNGTNTLTWTRDITTASNSTQVWKIKFVSPTTYELIKGNSFVAVYTTGVLITQPEIVFTVTPAAYNIGDEFEFYTYPYFGEILDITEPSLVVSLAGDITINASGGI